MRKFTFNGDNKQTERDANGSPITQYFFDDEGKRELEDTATLR